MTSPIGSTHLMEVVSTMKPTRINSEILGAGDKSPIKVRKPYTITKQRERWTEEEHQKFLEALKLYGRSWRHIEEHIGTKTAVQIRSHAQKFFSKLEREALTTRFPAGIACDIEIPPARPKRKPRHPYPRKASSTFLGIPLAFEEESKSPAAVYSALVSMGNPLKPTLQVLPFKNGAYISCSNQSKSGTLDRTESQRRLDAEKQANGSSTCLKLFGQTLLVTSTERLGTSTLDTLRPNNVNITSEPMAFASINNQAKVSGNLQISRKIELEAKNSSCSGSCNNEAEAHDRSVCMVKSEENLGLYTSLDCSKAETHTACLGEFCIGFRNQQSISSQPPNVSSKDNQARAQVSEACREHNKDRQKEGYELRHLGSVVESKTENSGANNITSVSNSVLPCFHGDLTDAHYMRCVQGHSSHALSQQEFGSIFEGFSQKLNPDIRGSSFKPWHLSQVATRQEPASSAITTSWPNSVSPSSVHIRPNNDAGRAASVTTFMSPTLPSWWTMKEVMPPASVLQKDRLYNPVAVIAGAKEQLFSSTVDGLDTGVKNNSSDTCKSIDELTTLFPSNVLEHHVCSDTSQKSSQECYSSVESEGGNWHSESKRYPNKAKSAKKRLRSFFKDKEVERRKSRSSGSSIGSHTPSENVESERMEDENGAQFSLRSDTEMQASSGVGVTGLGSGSCLPNVVNHNVEEFCSLDSIRSHYTQGRSHYKNPDLVNENQIVDYNGKIGRQKLLRQETHHTIDVNQEEKIQDEFEYTLDEDTLSKDEASFTINDKRKMMPHSSIKGQYCIFSIEQGPWEKFERSIEPPVAFSSTQLSSSLSQVRDDKDSHFLDNGIAKEYSASLETEENGMEDTLQVASSARHQEIDKQLLPVAKKGSLMRTRTYSGLGFVPYHKSLTNRLENC